MTQGELKGDWSLIAACSVRSEIPFINDEEPDPSGVFNWLNGFDDELVANAKPTSGLTMTIKPDGQFVERLSGTPAVYWFDEEGVLQEEVTPFSGMVVDTEQASYLCPASIPKWATPVSGRYGTAVLRYDDGDTKISDAVRRIGHQLVRTVNVVTDELYLDRVVILYQRVE
ncbi:MAG: hypothetical protein OSA97_11125 [Nevskia sp.]|nr:hypothetical protein [Nevskia sp.]